MGLDFIGAHPLTAREAVHTPCVFRAGLESLGRLPLPSLEGIRDFARFAGIGEGAIRTALSRARSEGSLLLETDAEGKARYRLAPALFARGRSQTGLAERPEGFLLAVFSFKSEEVEERAALRKILADFGFRKLAQNAYIHGRIDEGPLREEAAARGLGEHLFLFTCPDLEDRSLVLRIFELFDMEGRRRELARYLKLLRAFLPEGLEGDELARRLLYVGAVNYELVERGEPPFPARYLPKGYALAEIQALLGGRFEAGRRALVEYYEGINS